MEWAFSKYVGCGNDFVLFDNRQSLFPLHDKSVIQKICHRQLGIGSDGIILLGNSLKADFSMRIFNTDGSEAEMCGNGIRCLMKFLQELGFTESTYCIETKQRVLHLSLEGSEVCVEMGLPSDFKWNIPISFEGQTYHVHSLNTGVPHAVIFVEDIENFDLNRIGPHIRHHPLFSPKGTNVNVAQKNEDHIKIRTFERGVEGETFACGTGATAVAIAASHHYHLNSPFLIQTKLKDHLKIQLEGKGENVSVVKMIGPANRTFQGVILE